MNTVINGVEITPAIAEQLKELFEGTTDDCLLDDYVKFCNGIQDFLCAVLLGDDYDAIPNEDVIKECLRQIMLIRKSLKALLGQE